MQTSLILIFSVLFSFLGSVSFSSDREVTDSAKRDSIKDKSSTNDSEDLLDQDEVESRSADSEESDERKDLDIEERSSKAVLSNKKIRETYSNTFLFHYSYLDLWIPGKIGGSYSWASSGRSTWDLDYSRGSISFDFIVEDLGKLTEDRLSLIRRSYGNRESFHFIYGAYYYSFAAELGNEFLSNVSSTPDLYNKLEIQSLGVTWGLGNRWQWQNHFTLGVDWFQLFMPLLNLKTETGFFNASTDSSQKKEVQDAIDVVKKIPTFTLLKLHLGFSF